MITRLSEKLFALAGLENLKAWSQACLNRKELLNSLAEGMYGLNLEAAGRFQCRGEKPSCPGKRPVADIIASHLNKLPGERHQKR